MASDDLFHILPSDHWEAAQRQGRYAPASLASEGFIHLSEARQLLATAARFYRGQTDLYVLRIGRAELEAELRYEPADGDQFPHLFGPLNLGAVLEALPFPPAPDGTFEVPEPWRSRRADFS